MLTAGRSMVLTTAYDITRIAITDPKIADAVVVQPREVLIDGRSAGTVSLIVWGAGRREQYDVVVDPGVTTLQQTFQTLFPGEDIRVAVNDDAIILAGQVSTNAVMLKAAEIAAITKANVRVVNMLQLPGGSASQQVMLQVRFAEVNRAALLQAGFTFFTNAQRYSARTTTQQFAGPDFDDSESGDGLVFSDFLNLFFYDRKEGIGGGAQGARVEGLLPESRRAEPDRLQRPGGQLPGWRRVPDSDRPGRRRHQHDHDRLQGVRRAPEIHADHCRRRDPVEGRAGGQLARLQQRRHLAGVPYPGAADASGPDRRRAARRPVVRHRRPAEQRDAGGQVRDPDPEQAADHRRPVQEQVGPRRADRADGADHAAPGAAARPRRSAAAADPAAVLPPGAHR